MLFRKIAKDIEDHLKSGSQKILLIEGARQIGKSYIIREIGKSLFKNYIEIDFVADDEGDGLFRNIHKTEEFYLVLSTIAGDRMGDASDTLIFLDEIQHYPQYLTMLKFLSNEGKFRYIASGSLLGPKLRQATSIPVGSIIRKQMYQLDFEEFLIANNVGKAAIDSMRASFLAKESLSEETHNYIMGLFRRYLITGGLPDAVNIYLETRNIVRIGEMQTAISDLYKEDASKYDKDNRRKLSICRIYEMIPSQMENHKKRIVAKDIQDKKGDRLDWYEDEFEYLISSGIALNVNAVANPVFPLAQSAKKNLVKLYLNDVGLLTNKLFGANIRPILDDVRSVNLGALYETAVASELKAHGHKLYYYDNRKKGEVDFLIDDIQDGSVLPIEVKSGRDFQIHSALDGMLSTLDYNIDSAIVLSNNREVKTVGSVTYMPIYYVMFLGKFIPDEDILL